METMFDDVRTGEYNAQRRLLQDIFLGIGSHFTKLGCLSVKIFTNGQILTYP